MKHKFKIRDNLDMKTLLLSAITPRVIYHFFMMFINEIVDYQKLLYLVSQFIGIWH